VARLTIRLLGPFVAEREGVPLEGFRSDKARALLAFLAAQPERPWSRSALAELLWPDRPERMARTNLRNALANLRRVLGDGHAARPFLDVTASEVRAQPAQEHWVDVSAVEALLSAGPAGPEEATDPQALDRLSRALALARGEFLEGFGLEEGPFSDWLGTMREHWRGERVRIARVLARAQARLGDVDASEDATRHWLEFEPWDEEGHRHLMWLLARRGRRTAALAQFDECRRLLAEELGVEPDAQTLRLAAAIRAGAAAEPSEAPTSWPGLSVPDTTPPSPLFAREHELAALHAALRRSQDEGVGSCFVTGEPGSGKTALLAEFARVAQRDDPGLLCLWGQCSALSGRGSPFEPFVQVLRTLSGEAGAPPDWGAARSEQARRAWQRLPDSVDAFLRHGPDLLGRFVSPRTLLSHARHHVGVESDVLDDLVRANERADGTRGEPSDLRARLLDQVTEVLRHCSRRRLLVLLDDLQWVDEASVDLLFHLGRHLGAAQVLIVGAFRREDVVAVSDGGPHPLAAVVSELRSRRHGAMLELAEDRDPGFVDAVLDSEPNALDRAFRAQLLERTSGHPLFTIELLRSMQLRGQLVRDAHGRWVEGPQLRWDDLPERVEAAIEARVGHLSSDCRRLLDVASVEGVTFTAEVVAAISGWDVARVCEVLSIEAGRRQRLVSAQGVQPVAEDGLSLYRFRHGLFQGYLARHLDAVERARLHGQVGRVLERLYEGSMERYPEAHHLLALHFDAAGMAQAAVQHYVAAARQARRLSAYVAAGNDLRRALELLEALPASPERDRQELALRLEFGTVMTAVQGWAPPELDATYARARVLSERLAEDTQIIPALWQLCVFHVGRSEHAEVAGLFERLARLGRRCTDASLRALTRLYVSPFYVGRFEAAREHLEAAARDADPVQQRALAERFGLAPAAVALAYLSECLWLLGLAEEADRRQVEARALAAEVDHAMTRCYVHGRAAWLAALRPDDAALREHAGTLFGIARDHGLGGFILAGSFFRHLAAHRSEPADEHLVGMLDAIERYRASGTSLNRTAFLTHLAAAYGLAGHHGRGLEAADTALAESARSGERWIDAETLRTKAVLLVGSAGDDAEGVRRTARGYLEQAVRVARDQGAVTLERRAAAELAAL
jgi:DNA-binding SARP family transcriptional activator